MIKRWIRFLSSVAFSTCGYYNFFLKKPRSIPLTLNFHRVYPQDDSSELISFSDFDVTPMQFDKQLNILKKFFHFTTYQEHLNDKKLNSVSEKNHCFITFDDGWKDNFIFAFPILQKFNAPATIFLATGLIDTRDLYWTHILLSMFKRNHPSLNDIYKLSNIDKTALNHKNPQNMVHSFFTIMLTKPREIWTNTVDYLYSFYKTDINLQADYYLSWAEVQKMSDSGIHFGSHSVSHDPLAYHANDILDKELCNSKKIIENKLGKVCTSISLPHSSCNDNTINRIKYHNFIHLYGNEYFPFNENSTSFHLIPRLTIYSKQFLSPSNHFSESMFLGFLSNYYRNLK